MGGYLEENQFLIVRKKRCVVFVSRPVLRIRLQAEHPPGATHPRPEPWH
jgi:hypothetical protein